MSINTLVRTIVIPNSIAGEYKFEIYQDEDNFFYADISRKNSNGIWELGWDGYSFDFTSSLDDAVSSCKKFIENLEIDIKASKTL